MATVVQTAPPQSAPSGREDKTLLTFAKLMEGGREDEETVGDLDTLTKLLSEDEEAVKRGEPSVTPVMDGDCVDTILCYFDMRQPDVVRGHAALTISAYVKAAGEDGRQKLAAFFRDRIKRGTYDDYIVVFCVAAVIFPIVPDLTSELFLTEGFLPSLGPLIRRTWKSRKVETACLEMLNAACMQVSCREAVQKYCTEWLEEIVDQDPEEVTQVVYAADPDVNLQEGSVSMRRHSEHVQNLAAVVLAKLRAVQSIETSSSPGSKSRGQAATTSIEELSDMFTSMLIKSPEHESQSSVEGLAYASLRSKVKEKLAANSEFLSKLVETLRNAPPKSPLTYGALSILVNLTNYLPTQSEEEKRMDQLRAFANATGKMQADPLLDNSHVSERCKRVFEAGVTPALVSHSKNGSTASLALIVSIIYSLSMTPSLRGQLAQQGAVRLLIGAWTALPESENEARRKAAQGLARILISINPALIFGGSRPTPQGAAIRPLASLIKPDLASESRDLLPTFEALMALTNLASTDENTKGSIIRTSWDDIEEQLLSNNTRVSTAAVELVCNLVASPSAVPLFDSSQDPKGATRLHVLVALADAEDVSTRSGAGGALASLSCHESIVKAIVTLERGVSIVLGLCHDENEALRHRGAFIVCNMVNAPGETGKLARAKIRALDGLNVLKECAKMSRRTEVVEVAAQAIKILLEQTGSQR